MPLFDLDQDQDQDQDQDYPEPSKDYSGVNDDFDIEKMKYERQNKKDAEQNFAYSVIYCIFTKQLL